MSVDVSFIGKSLLLTTKNERILVLGDLHLGFGVALRKSGYFFPTDLIKKTLDEIKLLFNKIGRVERVVLLGDIKHLFGGIDRDERSEIERLFGLLNYYCNELIVIKGNHDVILPLLNDNFSFKLVDYFIWNSFVFIHGDRDFSILHDDSVKAWVLGHFHPAISLNEGSKQETYKCFLHGTYKNKKIYIVPSFFEGNIGTDPRDFIETGSWRFSIYNFEAVLVGENLENYSFGKVKTLL